MALQKALAHVASVILKIDMAWFPLLDPEAADPPSFAGNKGSSRP
jgi:hypothetical protein